MPTKRFDIEHNQVILHSRGTICATGTELVHSDIFTEIVSRFCAAQKEQDTPAIQPFLELCARGGAWTPVVRLLRMLVEHTLEESAEINAEFGVFLEPQNRRLLHEFVEKLYDFWRAFDRFMVLHSEPGTSRFEKRPYRSFNLTIESLTHLVRASYRDICENITGDHPRIYRQAHAGCDVGLIAVPRDVGLPEDYRTHLQGMAYIRQVWIAPPMVIDPPTNKRTGQFLRINKNPMTLFEPDREKWLCYPAQVGPIVVFIYFHQVFMGLGCSLANLFEMATDQQIADGPDAIFFYGAPPEQMAEFGDLPIVFYEDPQNKLLVGAVPAENRFGYFGYLKKMTLTLHNIAMIKRGRMPYHGAMMHIALKDGKNATIVIIGDTATGKSESIEALRVMAKTELRDLRIIADDMGSLDITQEGALVGYGTETGAFIRLDDLQQGYAFEQIDRAIIMSPQKVNARVVLPVTTLHEVLRGYPIDFLLYANNYEQVDADHPALERFETADEACAVFREGAAMAKGTTTATGLVHSYFANIFGAPQCRQEHDVLAQRVFRHAFEHGLYVGQLRTRLGIPGYEAQGPHEAAEALLAAISARK